MLPGYSGHLVSGAFLEQRLEEQPALVHEPRLTFPAIDAWCRMRRALGPASALRAVFDVGAAPLLRGLGFDPLLTVGSQDGALFASARGPDAVVGVLVARWGERLDPLWREAVVLARRQNAEWCLLFNGTHLRVIHAGRVYSRRHAEFDLELALGHQRSAAVLWMLASGQALARVDADGTVSASRLMQQSDTYASAVCGSLRTGVLEAVTSVLNALMVRGRSAPPVEAAFEQTLTVVYRLLFLLFAEARALVPLWHPVYRESYSLEGWCDAAAGGVAAGCWDALRAVSRLAHAGCDAGDLHVAAFNGRLFAPSRTPLLERRDLDDEAARRALVALSTRAAPDRGGRVPISYRDLGVEQLGAVYETLLDYSPHLDAPITATRGDARPVVTLRRGSGVRKSTGSFYTPQPLAQYLVRQSLTPLTHEASPDTILSLKVLDPAAGSGAFLVAAGAFLAEAYEAALIRWNGLHPSDISSDDRARFRRTIAERCLYGVDVNPMAVQLARLSLWLSTLAGDRPLSFLDHHLVTGDSLLGAWLTGLRRAPGRRPAATPRPLFDDTAAESAVRHALPVRFSLSVEPNDTPQQVRAKERRLAAISQRDTMLARWKRVADLWCAHWFSGSAGAPAGLFPTLADAILNGTCALPAAAVTRYLGSAEAAAASRRFFHWELEFPEVFFAPDGGRLTAGGFDAVIGNPPWDMLRADSGAPETRAGSRMESASMVRFTRDAGVYAAQTGGQANRYQLFLERAIALTRPNGRLGLVLPWGLASDHGSAPLRRQLFSRCAVDALIGLDNRRGVFPIHRSVRFALITATRGRSTQEFGCRLGEDDPAALEAAGDEGARDRPWCTVRLSPVLLERLSGDGLDIPLLKSARDLSIIERAAALFQPLGSPAGWHGRFGREVNASDDRDSLRPAGAGLPVIEGKQLEPFRVHTTAAQFGITAHDAHRLLGGRHQRRRLAYRDVASATNRLTMIAAILPAGCVSTHTVFCLRSPLGLRSQYFLCGLFNSLVVNYLVRLRVNSHVTTAIVERLPVPTADQAGPAYFEIAQLARRLTSRAAPDLAARLHAIAARLYTLTEDDFAHVLGTFPLIPEPERDAALDAFRRQD